MIMFNEHAIRSHAVWYVILMKGVLTFITNYLQVNQTNMMHILAPSANCQRS
jgi:hypothetical protein